MLSRPPLARTTIAPADDRLSTTIRSMNNGARPVLTADTVETVTVDPSSSKRRTLIVKNLGEAGVPAAVAYCSVGGVDDTTDPTVGGDFVAVDTGDAVFWEISNTPVDVKVISADEPTISINVVTHPAVTAYVPAA